MSFLEKLFGLKNEEKPPSPQEAIQRLLEIEEMLTKKTEFLEKKIEHELQTARKAGTKNKRVALAALKRKSRYCKQLQEIDGTLSTVEFQREALENAITNTNVFKGMESAREALKVTHKNLNVDEIHDIMDDLAEQIGIANEIGETFSAPVGFGQDYDEDELTEELESLEEEALVSKLTRIDETLMLPSVPTAAVSSADARASAEDEELAKLRLWLPS